MLDPAQRHENHRYGTWIMSVESLLDVIHHQYQPPLFFCAGLFASILCCLIALLVESKIRHREIEITEPLPRTLTYRRFLTELVSSPRHLGFVGGDVHELEDRDFHSDSE